MNSKEVAERVRSKFGDDAGVVIKDAEIIRWINDGQRHLVKENEGLLEKVVAANSVVDTQEYMLTTLATDIMVLRSVRYDGKHLKHMNLKEFDEYIDQWDDPDQSGGTGTPDVYTVFAGKLILFPIPDKSVTNGIKIYYTRYPVDVTDVVDDAIDLPLSYQNALVNYVLKEAYEKDEDWQGHNTKAAEVAADLAALKHREKHNNYESYGRITTLPEDW